MKNDNPFLINSYINNKFFCDRVQETERIISAVTNQRNICVFSENGIGKTMLIKHVEAELKELENYRFYSIELYKTENISQFINKFFKSIFHNNYSEKKIKKIFPGLDFKIITNKKTNRNQISLNELEINLELLFKRVQNYLSYENERIIFALDDIQSVLKYLNDNQLKELHNFITLSESISFVLSANNSKVLNILLEENFENIEKINLQKIDKKKYSKFIQKRFTKNNRKIDNNAIDYILTWSKGTTYYAHYLCYKIFDAGYKKITKKSVKETIHNIFVDYEKIFISYRQLLSEYQWKLLTAIAKEGNAVRITSANFINNYNLNAPSSVKTAVNALIDKGLVVRTKNTYHITNVFFEKWLNKY